MDKFGNDYFGKLVKNASPDGGITLDTFLGLEKILPRHVWQHFPGGWPAYLKNFVFLYENFYKTPLAGWRSEAHMAAAIQSVRHAPALRSHLPASVQTSLDSGISPKNLGNQDRRSLYALALRSLEPLKYRPLLCCSEAVSRSRFLIPPGGDSRACDQVYDVIRNRFEQYVLASERTDVWVVNLGHGAFDEDEWYESNNFGETRTVGPRITPGSAQQNWWFFVQPQGTGFLACWPVVSLSGRVISWTTFVAASVDYSWEVCAWFDRLSRWDKWRLSHIPKRQFVGKDGEVRRTNWRGDRVPIPGEGDFPWLEYSGWTSVEERLQERHRVETTQAKSLELFVSEMMSRAAADFSQLKSIEEFGLGRGAGDAPTDRLHNAGPTGGSPRGDQAGKGRGGTGGTGEFGGTGTTYGPQPPPQPGRPHPSDDGNLNSERRGASGGAGPNDGIKRRWSPGTQSSQSTRMQRDISSAPSGSSPGRPPDRNRDSSNEVPLRDMSATADILGAFARDVTEKLMMPDSIKTAVQAACNELREFDVYRPLVEQFLDARTQEDIAAVRATVQSALETERPTKTTQARWGKKPAPTEDTRAFENLAKLSMYLGFGTVNDAITQYGLRKWLH